MGGVGRVIDCGVRGPVMTRTGGRTWTRCGDRHVPSSPVVVGVGV